MGLMQRRPLLAFGCTPTARLALGKRQQPAIAGVGHRTFLAAGDRGAGPA
jgi:hypothetical protein